MERRHILAEGRVQGVGFRYFVRTKAIQYGLAGYVKNLDNGMVEMEVQGPTEKIEKLISELKNGGNMFIHVERLHIEQMENKKESDFSIRY
ncbi:acylphosphatase [Anaerobium acetethylicum]|uniref:acylphosphatase n=1 Tax=Anaerobium acetethylicum TaxID=1619234 RepID=A0A1D3TPB3_9FIRM|nr:acylphosphatase [Anaerobium acetethylicum]SCP95251.1 acylphosphatase [Anaerobium acetethylicum]